MCKELPIIPVNKAVDPKRVIRKKWRAKEEERHKVVESGIEHKYKLRVKH
jgi:hypothetical protein